MSKLKKIKKDIKNRYFDGHARKAYSQEGEDLVLKRIFGRKRNGFYVDVGAHHPQRFSNTYFFYKQGWRGINIDAMPGSMKEFDRTRPEDINIEQPIADIKTVLTYYAFNEPALNTFFKELAEERDGKNGFHIAFTKDIETTTLEAILDQHLPTGKTIDFLSIDVEGLDFNILKSNNWEKYKPEVVLVEIADKGLREILDSEIVRYLESLGYEAFSKTVNTVVFKRKDAAI